MCQALDTIIRAPNAPIKDILLTNITQGAHIINLTTILHKVRSTILLLVSQDILLLIIAAKNKIIKSLIMQTRIIQMVN